MRTVSYTGHLVATSSLAHGGKDSGLTHSFRRETLLGSDGTIQPSIPVLSGGTIRASLRRVAAQLTHDALVGSDEGRLPFDVVNALFSGGALRETRSGGEVLTGERQALIRDAIPALGLFGLGAGGRLMSGRLLVDKGIPVATETAWLARDPRHLPERLHSVFRLLQRERYSRRSDVMDAATGPYIARSDSDALPRGSGQMVYTIEALCAGTRLFHEIRGADLLPAEVAFLDELVAAWPARGFVGGHKARGMGRFTTAYERTVTGVAGKPAPDLEADVCWRTHMREHPDLDRVLGWL